MSILEQLVQSASAAKAGRIRPARIDNGRNGTKHYRVVEIQELKTADLVRAELQLTGQPL